LVLALAIIVLIAQVGPGWWNWVLRYFVSWVWPIMSLLAPSVTPHQSSTITSQFVVVFLVVAVPLYVALSYVPNVFLSSARAIRRLTRPYAASTSFLTCFVVAGTLAAIVVLFESTVLFPVGSPVLSLVYAWTGFVIFGWLAAILWCSVCRVLNGRDMSNKRRRAPG